MAAPKYLPRNGGTPGRQTINGVMPGGVAHLLLLAMRGAGGMRSEQVYERFPGASATLYRLKRNGLIDMPPPGQKGFAIHLTDTGRALTNPDGPLSRRATLINYCHL